MNDNSISYFETKGPDVKAIKQTFDLAMKSECQLITFLIPTLKQIKGSVLRDALSQNFVEKLYKDRKLTFRNKTIAACSYKTFNKNVNNGFVITLWNSVKEIENLEKYSFEKIMVIPWLEDDGKAWVLNQGGEVIGVVPS